MTNKEITAIYKAYRLLYHHDIITERQRDAIFNKIAKLINPGPKTKTITNNPQI